MLIKPHKYILTASLILISCFILYIKRADATPLIAMQAAERCDTCHEMPDSSNPKWVEENYRISERKCRLSCGVCHVNPSGGMLRNESGFIFGTKALPWKTDIPDDIRDSLQSIRSNKFLSLGGDFRFLRLDGEDRDTSPLLFPMQADLYANADLGNHVAFMTQFGMERGGNSTVREAFGMIKNLPYNSYLKVGKFVPPYGHRLEDHTAFIRTKVGLDHSQPGAYVSGYEIGAEPVLFFARASVFNADVTPASDTGKTAQGFSGEVGWRGLWLHLGLSYMKIKDFAATPVSETGRSAYGAFGALRYKNLSYLFEVDSRMDDIEGIGTSNEKALITFNELNYHVVKGSNIKLRYETYDPDEGITDYEQRRYVIGYDFFPYPFTELNVQYRINREEDERSNNDLLLMVHLWF